MATINRERLRFELTRRGLDQAALAKRARLRPETISRAATGHSVRAATISAIAKVLLEVTPKEGVDVLLVEPEKSKRQSGHSQALETKGEAKRDSAFTDSQA